VKNTNTKAFKMMVFRYLIDSAYDCDGMTDRQIVQHIYDRWQAEYCYEYNLQRYGNGRDNLKEWLAGLPLNIDFYNGDIVKITEQWHETTLSDSQAQRVIDNWFQFLAMKLLQLFKHYKIGGLV